MISWTTRGCIIKPPLAIAPAIVIICIGVTATACPKAFVPRLLSLQFSSPGAYSVPACSPSRSMPVGLPTPNLFIMV